MANCHAGNQANRCAFAGRTAGCTAAIPAWYAASIS